MNRDVDVMCQGDGDKCAYIVGQILRMHSMGEDDV